MRILITVLLLCISAVVFAQVNTSFRGTLNVYQSSGTSPNYEIRGIFNDTQGQYTSDSVDVGDVIFILEGSNCARLVVTNIISTTGGIIRADVTDSGAVLVNAPLGNAAILEETPNYGFPTFVDGISNDLLSCIQSHFALQVDDITSGSGGIPGTPGNTQDTVVQVAHGLSLLDPVFVNASGNWILSNISNEDSCHMAIVTEVISADTLILTYNGLTTQPAHGYTVGSVYFVQDDGTYATTVPTNFINDIAFYVVSDSTLYITEQRPISPMTDLNGIYSSSDTIPSGTIATAGNFQFMGLNNNYYLSFNPENDIILMRGDSVLLGLGIDGAVLTDVNASKRGLEYAASGYVTQPLSLTTKEYVDSTISDSLATITIPPTDLSFSGLGSPATLESSTGTDVTITAGTGIGLNVSGSDVTITNTGVTGTWGGVTTYLPRWTSSTILGADSRYRFNDAYPALEIIGTYNSNSTQLLLSAGGANPRIQTNTNNNGMIFAFGGSGSLAVQNTTGTTRFEIAGSANRSYFNTSLGVGFSTTPFNMLDVEGSVAIGAGYSGSNTAPANGLLVQGNTGIGLTAPSARLHVRGIGATSVTFPIFVDNSAGTGLFGITDAGGVHAYIRTGTATALGGWDANNKSTDLALASGLSIVAGALTPADASATNELQTVTNTSDATTHTVTLSNSGGSIQLVEGANISLTTSGTAGDGIVTISTSGGAGEVNTASNLGAGAGVYEQKSSVDLQFNSLVSESTTALTIAEDDPNNTIDFTINTGAVANGAGTLTTGDQVYDFVTAQGNVYTKDDTISEDRIVTIAPDYLFKIRANDTYSSSGYFNFGTLNIDDRFGFDLYDANGTSSGRINSYYDIGSTGKNQLTIENVNSTELGRILMTHDGSEEQLTILNKNGADTTLIRMTALGTTIQDDTELNVNTPNFQFTGAGFDVIASTNSVFTTPATQFTGTLRVDTDGSAATSLVGQDVSNRLTAVSLGYGLDLTSGVLLVDSLEYATQYDLSLVSGTTNLTFSGASSPVTLNSSSGTDVTFTAGTGISLTGTATDLTITNTGDTNAADDVTTAGGTSGQIAYFNGTNTITSESGFLWDATNNRLGVGLTPLHPIHIEGSLANPYVVSIRNTSASAGNVFSGIDMQSDVSGRNGTIFKANSGYTTYKIIAANDIGIYNGGGNFGHMSFLNDNTSGEIKFAAGGSSTAQMVIQSDGDVGIGTTSPSARLHIASATYPPAITERTTTGTSTQLGTHSFKVTTSNNMADGFGVINDFTIRDNAATDNIIASFGAYRSGADNSGAIFFKPYNAGVRDEDALIVLPSGNVGVNNATPAVSLDVTGAFRVSSRTGTADRVAGWANATGQSTDLTLASGLSISGGALTPADASATNELQTITSSSDATSHTVTLSNSGGSIQLVEGSNITLTTTGTAGDGIVTIASTGGATDLTFTGASSPYTLNSSSGTDVTFLAGEGIALSRATNELTVAAPVMTAATGGGNGAVGIVPQPNSGENVEFLRGDATWAAVEYIKGATIETPGSSENVTLFYTRKAITIREVADVVRGTTPSVTWQIKYATTRDSGTPTDLFSASRTTTSTSGATTTTFNDATIGAGNWIWLVTSATSGTNDELSVQLTYTID